MSETNNVHPIKRAKDARDTESAVERMTAALLRKHSEGNKVVSMMKQLRTPST